MRTANSFSSGQRRLGGLAAIYLALAYVAAMPYFLLASRYAGATTAADKVAVLAVEHGSLHVMYLVTYVVFGLALCVVALVLQDEVRPTSPLIARTAAAVGLMWATVLVASGLVFNAGMSAAVALYPSDPAGAAALWQAIEPVTDGLSCADGEVLGGLWMLLLGAAGLRAQASRGLSWFGVTVGAVGLASMVPGLGVAAYAFGLLQVVWFTWVGIRLLRPAPRPAPVLAPVR